MSTMTTVEPDRRSPVTRWTVRLLLALLIAVFATFWTWALFFASKEAVNKIDDRAWAERAEQICAEANQARIELSDYRSIVGGDDAQIAALVRERAGIVDRATDIIEQMLDDVVAVEPLDEKGRAIVPKWEAEYRAYLDGRRTYANDLRATGENLPFYEPGVEGVPVSERLETFAGDNEMPACAPPRDLTR
jgi:hypothetical protein